MGLVSCRRKPREPGFLQDPLETAMHQRIAPPSKGRVLIYLLSGTGQV